MAVGEEVSEFLTICGHDGSEIIWPELPDPECRRAHHIQECIVAARVLGKTCTPVEIIPILANPKSNKLFEVRYEGDHFDPIYGHFQENWRRFNILVARHTGVLEGVTPSRKGHAVAFEDGVIYDPDGKEYERNAENFANNGFFPKCVWIIE
jgi:hypothetical protein